MLNNDNGVESDYAANNTIDVADFLIEMQAAHITGDGNNEHNILKYILQNDAERMDFFDYLTFFPLFIFAHETIVHDASLMIWGQAEADLEG